MGKPGKIKRRARARGRGGNGKTEDERRPAASEKAEFVERPLQPSPSRHTLLNACELTLNKSQYRADSGLGFQRSVDQSTASRSPTPALTLSMSSLRTEDDPADMSYTIDGLAIRNKKLECPISIVHPAPARSTHEALSKWQDENFDSSHFKVERDALPGLKDRKGTTCTVGCEPRGLLDSDSSLSWVMVSNHAAMPHGVKTAANISESSSGASRREQIQGISPGLMQRQISGFSNQPNDSDDDVSAHENGEGQERRKGACELSGYRCVFCATNNGIDPTQQCNWPRKYVSQLKVHHLHSDHPGGPFACCKNCFAIGVQQSNSQSGESIFIRFKSKEDVSAHERSCIIHICIHEGCPNYDRVPLVSQPCTHPPKRNGHQIWKMWYRRAHGLSTYDQIPEPNGSTALAPQTPPSMTRPPQRPHLVTPVTPGRPSTGPPVLQHSQYGGLRGIAPNTSPSVDPLTPSDSRSRSSSTGTSSQQGLENFARELLVLARDSTSSWSSTLERLYNSTGEAAMQRRLTVVDPNLRERIITMQTLIDHCRALMTRNMARTRDAWSHLNIAARTAFPQSLPPPLPVNWLSIPILNDSQPSSSSHSSVSNQTSNTGGAFLSVNTPSMYPPTIDVQDMGTATAVFDDDLQHIIQAQAASDNFEQIRRSYTNNSLGQLWAELQASRRSDVQSVVSAPIDSGIYSAEQTTNHSGNDKDPGARRTSMSNIRDPNHRYSQ